MCGELFGQSEEISVILAGFSTCGRGVLLAPVDSQAFFVVLEVVFGQLSCMSQTNHVLHSHCLSLSLSLSLCRSGKSAVLVDLELGV